MYIDGVTNEAYQKNVDEEVLSFVHDIVNGGTRKSVTVGFVNDDMNKRIKELTGLEVNGNRIILTADAVRHILRRHGKDGLADHSMEDFRHIARMCYVLSNYDEITYAGEESHSLLTKDGNHAPHIVISKRINGFYYIIEAVSDGKKNQNTIVSAYLKNTVDK